MIVEDTKLKVQKKTERKGKQGKRFSMARNGGKRILGRSGKKIDLQILGVLLLG